MNWNEKIDWIKRSYQDEDFSVPHIGRKGILRKIENQFIMRGKDYYDLNIYLSPFIAWWDHLKKPTEFRVTNDIGILLNKITCPYKDYWLACDFTNQILIYKSKRSAALDLLTIGQTWSTTYYLIELKYEFLIGMRIEQEEILVRYCGKIGINE